MRIKKRPFHFFLLVILFAIGLGYLIFSYPPTYIIRINHFALTLLLLFFIGVFGLFFSFFTYVTYSKVQGLLFGTTVIAYLLLRLSGLTHIFFTFMLIALFITLELFFLKKK